MIFPTDKGKPYASLSDVGANSAMVWCFVAADSGSYLPVTVSAAASGATTILVDQRGRSGVPGPARAFTRPSRFPR